MISCYNSQVVNDWINALSKNCMCNKNFRQDKFLINCDSIVNITIYLDRMRMCQNKT